VHCCQLNFSPYETVSALYTISDLNSEHPSCVTAIRFFFSHLSAVIRKTQGGDASFLRIGPQLKEFPPPPIALRSIFLAIPAAEAKRRPPVRCNYKDCRELADPSPLESCGGPESDPPTLVPGFRLPQLDGYYGCFPHVD